ncbi:MAG: patatin-like phospholipase family protein [Bacteroidales bacterium]|nr:patatin-like phospholipase family protein [Bacteroidales bacterium]
MSKEAFIQQPEFQQILEKARDLKIREYSDIKDQDGNQYVDLVQEGGGVLGIALVGYTYVLEEAGIRFFSLAGTSAGAINTMIMAGIGPINDRKSDEILEVLSGQNLFDFVDGDPKLKKIVQQGIDGTPFKKLKWKLLWNIKKLKKALLEDLGLNPGNEFEKWIEQILKNSGAHLNTIGELIDLRKKENFPSGLIFNGQPIKDEQAAIHIITSDITTQSKVRFPDMAKLYWGENYKEVSAAKIVRASMSVPFFFTPFEINNMPNAGQHVDEDWKRLTGYTGRIPETVKFVDGGMISNFPINVFHRPDGGVPRKPTFGVKLSAYREEFSEVDDIGSFIGSMVSTMRHDSDNEFLINNPDYQKLICFIDADKNFKWLNFNMTPERQQKLFLLGAKKAIKFLEDFNWPKYKDLRSS